jgi:hypothetical protein
MTSATRPPKLPTTDHSHACGRGGRDDQMCEDQIRPTHHEGMGMGQPTSSRKALEDHRTVALAAAEVDRDVAG